MAKLSPFAAVGTPLPFIILLPFFFFFFSSSYAGGASTTIGDLLRAHGLPAGLLPTAVESFAHDPSSGLLEVRIGRLCYVQYGDGLSFFDREVRGNLSYGAIRGVEGWSQEELFLWLPVKGIVVSDPESGVILFDIGLARKRLPISSFEDPPDCLPIREEAADGIVFLPFKTVTLACCTGQIKMLLSKRILVAKRFKTPWQLMAGN